MNKYVNLKFHAHYKATIGTDFLTKEMNIENKRVSLQASEFIYDHSYYFLFLICLDLGYWFLLKILNCLMSFFFHCVFFSSLIP